MLFYSMLWTVSDQFARNWRLFENTNLRILKASFKMFELIHWFDLRTWWRRTRNFTSMRGKRWSNNFDMNLMTQMKTKNWKPTMEPFFKSNNSPVLQSVTIRIPMLSKQLKRPFFTFVIKFNLLHIIAFIFKLNAKLVILIKFTKKKYRIEIYVPKLKNLLTQLKMSRLSSEWKTFQVVENIYIIFHFSIGHRKKRMLRVS